MRRVENSALLHSLLPKETIDRIRREAQWASCNKEEFRSLELGRWLACAKEHASQLLASASCMCKVGMLSRHMCVVWSVLARRDSCSGHPDHHQHMSDRGHASFAPPARHARCAAALCRRVPSHGKHRQGAHAECRVSRCEWQCVIQYVTGLYTQAGYMTLLTRKPPYCMPVCLLYAWRYLVMH